MTMPNRAYAAAPSGAVSVIEFPTPGSAGHAEATAAILAQEMARRDCRLFVLVQGEEPELIRLDGHRLGRHPAQAARLLRIERTGRKIRGLRRLDRREDPAPIRQHGPAPA